MRTFAVIVTAYQVSQWIGECLEGFYHQQPCPGWDYELYLGVDACQDTARTLTHGGWTYWTSEENVGTYILSNSLMALCQHADLVLRFDSDDVPLPHLLKTLVATSRGEVPALGTLQDCNAELRPSGRIKTSSGVTAWPRTWLDRLGGFRPDRVACDNDMMARAGMLGCDVPGIKRVAIEAGVNYLRRRHPQSLTKRADCGMRAAFRAEIKARHAGLREAGASHVDPVTTELVKHHGTRSFFRVET